MEFLVTITIYFGITIFGLGCMLLAHNLVGLLLDEMEQ